MLKTDDLLDVAEDSSSEDAFSLVLLLPPSPRIDRRRNISSFSGFSSRRCSRREIRLRPLQVRGQADFAFAAVVAREPRYRRERLRASLMGR
jgi:hypothetical protein